MVSELPHRTNCPGIGMDSCVIPLKYKGLAMLQTTDYFYPLVDDPYMMGQIACANVLSDLYAMGVVEIDNMLMLLCVSKKMTEREIGVITPLLLRGFKDAAASAGTKVSGGETAVNPWFTVGGVATSICTPCEYIVPENAKVGDVIVLTKPLGTQVAVTIHTWLDRREEMPERWEWLKQIITKEEVEKSYLYAMHSMARLNKTGALLMHKYNAHAATDVTGFGILGHARNLAKFQKRNVTFVIHNLPIIEKMAAVAKTWGFKLTQGVSPETSGGLLICMQKNEAAEFCKEIKEKDGYQAWIIGRVEEGDKSARLIAHPRVIEVPFQ